MVNPSTIIAAAQAISKEDTEGDVQALTNGVDGDGTTTSTNEKDSCVVHLGFCVLPTNESEDSDAVYGHASPDWSLWDGGRVGGKPTWLIPQQIPTRNFLQCCSRDMLFLLQIYCPAPSVSEGAAFHRTIYVFICSNNSMHTNSSTNCGGVKVLRCQLPRENSYYPSTTLSMTEEEEEAQHQQQQENYCTWKSHLPETWKQHTCQVCGLFAAGKCPLQNAFFCGKNHQKEHMKLVHKSKNKGANVCFPSVFPEYDLVVEDEPCEGSNDDDDQMKLFHSIKSQSLFNNDESQDDATLEQTDLNQMLGNNKSGSGVTDPRTIEFYTRITRGGKSSSSQCLRYCRWPASTTTCEDTQNDDVESPSGMPLWISSDCIPNDHDIPPCIYCSSIRKPEFQIMPQILNYLHANKANGSSRNATAASKDETMITKEARDATIAAASIIERDGTSVDDETKYQIEQKLQEIKANVLRGIQDELNFGPIVIYTCTNSCNGGNGSDDARYLEEFAWRQPPLDEY
jgi:pre-rRNA-processing protein TSR4